MEAGKKKNQTFSPLSSVSKGKNITFSSYTPSHQPNQTNTEYEYTPMYYESIPPPISQQQPQGERFVRIIKFAPLTFKWSGFMNEENPTFSFEVFSQMDNTVQPFQNIWLNTGIKFMQEADLPCGFHTMFKGWKLTDKVVTRDKIINLAKPQPYNSTSTYLNQSDEFQVNLHNFSAFSFNIPKGTPLGRVILTYNNY